MNKFIKLADALARLVIAGREFLKFKLIRQ